MRTIPFVQVYESVVRLTGGSPENVVKSDLARKIVQAINMRTALACQSWRWPEWEVTEERAFRSTWNNSRQFHIAGENGRPDEFFYLGDTSLPTTDTSSPFGANSGYYKVKSTAPHNPPVGTLPTNTTYFEPMEGVDTFIEYDQACKRSIGMVLGVYRQNPRNPTGSMNGGLKYMPSERGIDVLGAGLPTVFVTYKLPIPKYTMVPWVQGGSYLAREVKFDPVTGECFQALAATSQPLSDANYWRRVPFLSKWLNYVVNASYVDATISSKTTQAEQLGVQLAQSNAETYLQMEVDALVTQGQKLRWSFYERIGNWCESQQWNGGSVSTLSDVCESNIGWVYPTVAIPGGPALAYNSSVTAILTADGTPSLQQMTTAGLGLGTLVDIVVDVDGGPQSLRFRLDSGLADAGDTGQVSPDDYDGVTNNVHWVKVGG